MRVLAISDPQWGWIVKEAAGVVPHINPPLYDRWIQSQNMLEGYRLIYLDLHYDGGACMGNEALCAPTIRMANLSGTVVFTGACNIEIGPILPAFLEAGATVVGGEGTNYEYSKGLVGAHLLGMWFRRVYALSGNVALALGLAKARVWMGRRGTLPAARDALKFKIWRPGWTS